MSEVTLLTPTQIHALAKHAQVVPTKKRGQNFVIDPNTIRRIVRLSNVTGQDRVVEVGPGLGSLTLGLLETGAQVVAVEIDPRLAVQLPATIAQYAPHHTSQIEVLLQDALTVESLSMQPTHMVANLPYNIAVVVVLHFLETFPTLRSGLLMVQAEVGHRISAVKGNKTYGVPTLKAAWYGSWTLAAHVPRNVFWPVPNVDSVLVRFEAEPHMPHIEQTGIDPELLRKTTFAIIDAAFQQRRKMLRQSCASFFGSPQQAIQIFEHAHVDPTLRAEQLDLADYICVAQETLKVGRLGL